MLYCICTGYDKITTNTVYNFELFKPFIIINRNKIKTSTVVFFIKKRARNVKTPHPTSHSVYIYNISYPVLIQHTTSSYSVQC